MRDPNRNIDMLLAQTQDPIAKSRIDAHFRVTTQKVTHNRDHIASAEQHGSAYRQISSQLRFAREESFFSLVRGGQNGATTFEIQRAFFSKADPTRSAMKKHHPEVPLKGRKNPNHRGQEVSSALAAAVRLPFSTIRTNVSMAPNLSMTTILL